jgi:transcriptional regulator with XRE-family HTH domain
MDDLAIGRLIRLTRIRRRLRQEDVATAAGVSQSTVSRLEHGTLRTIQVGTLRRVCEELGIRVRIELQGEGGQLDRLGAAHHAAMSEVVARLFDTLPGWVDEAEVTFSIWGERGSVDVLAWHAATRSLLVIELKTELVDCNETLATFDRKLRLATEIAAKRGWRPVTVSAWLLIAESGANRRAAERHGAMLRSRLPADGHAIARWLRRPSGAIHAMSFLSSAHAAGVGQRLAPVRRVRRGTPARSRAA